MLAASRVTSVSTPCGSERTRTPSNGALSMVFYKPRGALQLRSELMVMVMFKTSRSRACETWGRRYQQAELQNGRWAMLGVAGVLFPELLASAGLGGPAAATPWYLLQTCPAAHRMQRLSAAPAAQTLSLQDVNSQRHR